ncbi:MAG TPA: c-type cytochrome domain-containing protein [Verrucomicrobiae bacterium]
MRAPKHLGWSALGIALGLAQSSLAQITPEQMRELQLRLPEPATVQVDFARDIKPILDTSCLRCHGPERPKGRFRLDNREAALKGGEHGTDIVPGSSAASPLIYYVAHLVEDMEMPPTGGREKPLTNDEIALLRAWIDQGVPWTTAETNRVIFSVTPSIQWFSVKGDERKFREHTGIKEGWNGGLQSLYIEEQLTSDRRLTVEARAFPNPEEYELHLQLEQRDLGFVRFGFEQYREYYDDTGGYYRDRTPPSFDLNRDLHLDIGRAYVDFGLTLPDWPRMVVGYAFQYRDGAKSILQWGDVGTIEPEFNPSDTDAKKIYPAHKQIEEQVHVFKFDLDHELAGVGIHNRFRAELYDNDTRRDTRGFLDLSGQNQNRTFSIKEGHDHFQASDAFMLEKQLLDWLYVSSGYHYGHLDGQYGLRVQPNFPTGEFLSFDRYYFTDSIILEQDTHTFNANAQLGPFAGLTLYGGAQSEWMSQRGFGDVRLDEGFPPSQGGVTINPVFLDSNLDRASVEEHVGARYTELPFTVLFIEGRGVQQSIDQTEERLGSGQSLLRDTDTTGETWEGRVGFTISPWTPVSLTAHYKRRARSWDYDHLADIDEWRGTNGYSAFITDQQSDLDEISAKLSIRPATWVKVGLTYQLLSSESEHTTHPIDNFGFGDTPGGTIYAYNSDAHVYSANVTLNPWRRLYLNNTVSWRQSRSWTGHNFSPVIVNYEGDLYSLISGATYLLDNKTDLNANYTYSWADYGQNNAPEGLPIGLQYDWHIISAGITRRLSKNVTTNLQYRFYAYDEDNAGPNNYTAHGILASLSMILD